MGCARCHDHKYDPLTQKEFYQVFAYFNNVPEKGKALKFGNSPPYLKSPTREQQRHLQQLDPLVSAARLRFQQVQPLLRTAQRAWEKAEAAGQPCSWSPAENLVAHFPLDGNLRDCCSEKAPAQKEELPAKFGPGRVNGAVCFDGQRFSNLGNVAEFGFFDKFSFGVWIHPGQLDAPRPIPEPHGRHRPRRGVFADLEGRQVASAVRQALAR